MIFLLLFQSVVFFSDIHNKIFQQSLQYITLQLPQSTVKKKLKNSSQITNANSPQISEEKNQFGRRNPEWSTLGKYLLPAKYIPEGKHLKNKTHISSEVSSYLI